MQILSSDKGNLDLERLNDLPAANFIFIDSVKAAIIKSMVIHKPHTAFPCYRVFWMLASVNGSEG